MTNELSVRHLDGDQFAIDVRGHTIVVDQPTGSGGLDEGPTPTELFVAGLASCVAYYARRHLARHEQSTDGLQVTAGYSISGRPARITDILITIQPPDTLPPDRLPALLAVSSRCTLHNTLLEPPLVTVELAERFSRAG